MTIKLPLHSANGDDERGQVLVIFAAAFVVIIMMLALLFDGARGIVLRRQIQDASDAASLAAANVIQGTTAQGVTKKGCSATAGPPPGTPQAWVIAAAKASVAQNLPGFDLTKVFVRCPGPDNWSVQVTMGENAPTFFGSIFGTGPLTVSTHSVAVNGADKNSEFSVVLLDPAHCGANCSPWLSPPPPPEVWPNNYNGCPSFGINGTITAQFDSAIYVNSACDAAHNGAFATKGGSATLTFGNGAAIHLVGEYKPQALVVTPAPIEHQKEHSDPLLLTLQP